MFGDLAGTLANTDAAPTAWLFCYKLHLDPAPHPVPVRDLTAAAMRLHGR